MATTAMGQTITIQYDLEDVWLLPDISHPGEPPQLLTGSFEWTYAVGDFENGSGQFIQLTAPWYNPSLNELNINIDLTSIELSLIGNFQDRGFDLTLFLVDPLSPNQPSAIDNVRSIFEIQLGATHQGHAISGSVVPNPALALFVAGICPSDVQLTASGATPNGRVAIIYAFGQGSVVIPNGVPCSGVVLGLNNTATLAQVITANVNGDAVWNTSVPAPACGHVFLQALDLSNCATSNAELLQ